MIDFFNFKYLQHPNLDSYNELLCIEEKLAKIKIKLDFQLYLILKYIN